MIQIWNFCSKVIHWHLTMAVRFWLGWQFHREQLVFLHVLMYVFQNQLSSWLNPFVYGHILCFPGSRHNFSYCLRLVVVPFHSSLPGLISFFWRSKSSQWHDFSWFFDNSPYLTGTHRNSPEFTGTHWKPIVKLLCFHWR